MPTNETEQLQTELVMRDPRRLRTLQESENARYMTSETYSQLVDNIRRDGKLTSTPLIYMPAEDRDNPKLAEKETVISGNHRVRAAADAGLEQIPCINVLTILPRERFIALQLSHNAITGVDDLSVLQKLYDELSLDLKQYSGLSDEDFKADWLSLSGIPVGAPIMEEVVLLFLPEDADLVESRLTELSKLVSDGKKRSILTASVDSFGTFLDSLSAVKEFSGVHNTAAAIELMSKLALDAIEELDDDEDEG